MFCDYCINDWLDRKRKCPICREEICIIRENDLATPPLYIRQMINELQVTCENCNAIMNMEAYLVHKKSCKADLSAGLNPDKAEIKKLQNKINCLEGQVASKTNEVKMVTQQRNQLSEEVKKLKQEIQNVKETSTSIVAQNQNQDQLKPKKSRFLKNSSPSRLDQDRYDPYGIGETDNPRSTSKTPTQQTTSEPIIKYITDPSLTQQISDLQSTLESQKARYERQMQNLKEDFEFQSGRDKRKIDQLKDELEEKEEEIRNGPLPWQSTAVRNAVSIMESSFQSSEMGLSVHGLLAGNQNQSQNPNPTQTQAQDLTSDPMQLLLKQQQAAEKHRAELQKGAAEAQSQNVGNELINMENMTNSTYSTELATVKAVLEAVTEENLAMQAQLQAYMSGGIPPPISSSTSKNKNSDDDPTEISENPTQDTPLPRSIQRDLTNKSEEIDRLKTTVKRLEGQRDKVFEDLLAVQKEKSTIKTEAANNQKLVEDLRKEHVKNLKDLKHQNKVLQWAIDDNEIFVDNYKQEIQRLKNKISRLEMESEELRMSLARARLNRIENED